MSLKEILISNGINEKKSDDFYRYYELLTEWNEKINLTAITEEDQVAVLHFLDCIKGTEDIVKDNMSVIDVGTGAGFPGLPIKINNPNLNLTLVDSLNKRINFLDEVIGELGIEDVVTIHSRAEELGRDTKHREKYDVCVSRAVANLTTLCELCLPFVKKGGLFVSLKGPKAHEEAEQAKKAISLLGGRLREIKEYDLPDGDINHNVVIIEKISQTPTKYPRKAPKPSKEPLI